MLLEKCIVQHSQTNNVFTLQPTKVLVPTTPKSAMPALTYLLFYSRNKNRQKLYLVEMVHIVLPEKRVVTTKKKKNHHFSRCFSPSHNQAHQNLNQRKQKTFHLRHNHVASTMVDTVNSSRVVSRSGGGGMEVPVY